MTQGGPFERLSTEVLSLVLLNAVSINEFDVQRRTWNITLPNQVKSYEAYRLVSRQWNNTIITEPAFWSSCSVEIRVEDSGGPLDDECQLELTIHALRRHFARSGAVPLTLCIRLSFGYTQERLDKLQHLVQFISSYTRWECLELEQPDSAGWSDAQYPWWCSLFGVSPSIRLYDEACFRAVQSLVLECESSCEDYFVVDASIGSPISKVFPSLVKLHLSLEVVLNVELLPKQLCALKNLTWLSLSFGDYGETPSYPALRLVHDILSLMPQLQHFEPRLGVDDVPGEGDDDDQEPNTFGLSVLVHPSLTSLTIPDPTQLCQLFSLTVFPALKTLVVGNGDCVDYHGLHDHIGCLERMLGPSPQLRSLYLARVNLTDDKMTTILCTLGTSLRSLHIVPHQNHATGAFLTQLMEQSETKPVLPQLAQFTVDVKKYYYWDGFNSTCGVFDSFNMNAFTALVEDPRRTGQRLERGVEPFEVLERAVFRMGSKEVCYVR
jgi:hypothetical protein